jgi:DNA-binding response OmpR family regulator
MSGPSKVIVLDPDPRARRQVQLGLVREGVPVLVPELPERPAQLRFDEAPGLVVVGGANGVAGELVRHARELLASTGVDVPILCAARGISRRDAEAAGADEVLAAPLYLRDVVTVARLLRGTPASQRGHLVGSLVETTGVYTLVRALAALGRSAVLTLVRGLRRGEVRFYRGEVTSVQVGLIHGQAALHQLLLWTDARFDFAHEDTVRRQQIPLTPEELFADAEGFLHGVRESAGSLSPSTVLEPDVPRIQDFGAQIPDEVHGVLRMFDGHRVLTDVLEDSPYRVFETLRVAQKALEVGLLRPVDAQRPKATWKAVLAIDEWLVGSDTREAVVERTAAIDSGPVTPSTGKRGKGKGKGKRRGKQPQKAAAAAEPAAKPAIDWGALVPRSIGAEVGPLSPIIPALAAHGEVELPTRDRQREGLEALMDTDKRHKIFPTDIGLEPSVVVTSEADEWTRTVDEAKRKTAAEDTAPVPRTDDVATATGPTGRRRKKHDKSGKAAKKARQTPAAGVAVATAAPQPAATAAPEPAITQATTDTAPPATAPPAPPAPPVADAVPPATADQAANQGVTASDSTEQAASTPEAAPPERTSSSTIEAELAAAKARVHENVEKMRLLRLAREEAEARANEVAGRTSAVDDARAYAARVKAAAEAKRVEAERAARDGDATRDGDASARDASATSTPTDAGEPGERPGLDAHGLVRALVADAVEPSTEAAPPAAASSNPASEASPPAGAGEAAPTAHVISAAVTVPVPRSSEGDAVTTPFVRPEADSVRAMVAEPIALAKSAPTDASSPAAVTSAVADEASDGIIRSAIAAPDSDEIRARQRHLSGGGVPAHDGPPFKETTGEIPERPRADVKDPRASEPSILVADLAAVHHAASTVAAKPVPPPEADAASSSRELEVSDVRRDAVAFSEVEEAFFKSAESHTQAAPRFESFDDLDEGYEPLSFWDRLLGRRKRKKP